GGRRARRYVSTPPLRARCSLMWTTLTMQNRASLQDASNRSGRGKPARPGRLGEPRGAGREAGEGRHRHRVSRRGAGMTACAVRLGRDAKIGRASCRERVKESGGEVVV